MSAIYFDRTRSERVLASSVPSLVTCGTACGTKTLAQAQAADPSQIVDSDTANVGALLAALPTSTVVPAADLLMALLPKEALPIEKVATDAIVAASPLPSAGSAGYQIGFDMSCGRPAGPGRPAGAAARLPPDPGLGDHDGRHDRDPGDGLARRRDHADRRRQLHRREARTVALTAEPPAELGGPLHRRRDGVQRLGAGERLRSGSRHRRRRVRRPAGAGGAPAGRVVTSETVYTGQLGAPGNVDYFTITPQPAAGSAIIVTLSHLPADYDLVLYGPGTASLRASPFKSPSSRRSSRPSRALQERLLATDGDLSPTGDGSVTAPEVIDDVPLLPAPSSATPPTSGAPPTSPSTRPSIGRHRPFTIQVSGFNGAASPPPYLSGSPCWSRLSAAVRRSNHRHGGTEGTLPSNLDPGTRTLFLVNQERLGDLYGATAASDVMSKLDALATYHDPAGDHSTSAARSSRSTATPASPPPTTPGTPIRARPPPPTRS